MNNPDNSHLADERLRAFGLGKLDREEWEEAAVHVEACDACSHRLLELPTDSLSVLLRDSTDGDRNGANSTIGADPDLPEREPTPVDEPIPHGLIDHPRYRIIERLGSGGMGTVYLAEHKLMQRFVALKLVKRDLVNRADHVVRFLRTVKLAAKLKHENIVIAHDADVVDGVPFLVMEYVDGKDLSRFVKQNAPLPVSQACDFARQTALGLQHAWERKMVHRDIKPRNLMVDSMGRVKILDFGLARFVRELNSDATREAGSTTEGTIEGALLGTLDYIAPEQADDPRSADIRADIYSLGCTLYYLLARRTPFHGLSPT